MPFLAIQLLPAAQHSMPGDLKTRKVLDVRMASAHLQERRETRYPVPVDIEVTGIRNGEVFHSRTVTRNVSDWGCSFVIPFELKPEDIVAIRVVSGSDDPSNTTQSLFQLVRITEDPDGWLIGAWKLDGKNLWGAALERINRVGRDPDNSEAQTCKEKQDRSEPER